MQLGYYRDATHAMRRMLATGGGSLFRALPATLAMNIPYSSLMMMSNESLRRALNPSGAFSLPCYLTAGTISGALAAAATTPIDVIKTRLNTQGLRRAKTSKGELGAAAAAPQSYRVRYQTSLDAFQAVLREHGARGFWRGIGPRVLQISPSNALSWCAYESAKQHLKSTPNG